MLDSLVNVISGAWWSYPLIAFLATFDVIVPVLPSETAVVTGGIIAARGGLLLPLVLIVAAAGAFAGDNLAYWIGRKAQRVARRWLLRGEKGQKLINWAARLLDQYGGSVLIVGRFIPGGRTAIAVGSGIVSYPWRRFALYDAVGAVTWATVNSVIGYVGGKAFERQTWLAFVVSFAAAILVGAVVELVRRVAGHQHKDREETETSPSPPALPASSSWPQVEGAPSLAKTASSPLRPGSRDRADRSQRPDRGSAQSESLRTPASPSPRAWILAITLCRWD